MELGEAARRRRMVRSFTSAPVSPEVLDRLLRDALRAPSAGNTRGTAWVVLVGEETSRYWEAATTPEWRAWSRRWQGLSSAPVLAVSLASPSAYVRRYAEPDKARPAEGVGGDVLGGGGLGDDSLGTDEDAWPVPYWFGDAAFGVMTLLLGAAAEGLGACFLGNFRNEGAVLAALGVPEGWRLFGTVALGHPGGDDPRSASLGRPAPRLRLHRGRWGADQ